MSNGSVEVIVVRGTRPNSPAYQVVTYFPVFYATTYAFDRIKNSIDEICSNQLLHFSGLGSAIDSFDALPPGLATALNKFINAVSQHGSNYDVTITGPNDFSATIDLREAFTNLGQFYVTTGNVTAPDGQPARGAFSHNGLMITINFDLILMQEGSAPSNYLPSVYETFLHEVLHKYSHVNSLNWGAGVHSEWNFNFPEVIEQFIADMKAHGIDLDINDTADDTPCS